jgi:hypothetical protein
MHDDKSTRIYEGTHKHGGGKQKHIDNIALIAAVVATSHAKERVNRLLFENEP